jgi:hypothetical protein
LFEIFVFHARHNQRTQTAGQPVQIARFPVKLTRRNKWKTAVDGAKKGAMLLSPRRKILFKAWRCEPIRWRASRLVF